MKKAVEPCLICSNLPCTCGSSSTRKAPKKPTPQPTSSRTNRFGSVNAIQRPVFAEPEQPVHKPRLSGEAIERHVKTEAELEFEAAVLNLKPLLDKAELQRYKHIFHPSVPTSIEKRILDWRERNGLNRKD